MRDIFFDLPFVSHRTCTQRYDRSPSNGSLRISCVIVGSAYRIGSPIRALFDLDNVGMYDASGRLWRLEISLYQQTRRPLSFLFKYCLKAQIFEVILPTPVNTANADHMPLSIRFAAHHRRSILDSSLSIRKFNSKLPRSLFDLCDFEANAVYITQRNTTRSRLTFERCAHISINSAVFSGVDLGGTNVSELKCRGQKIPSASTKKFLRLL
ncbi:hypothetical protein ALC56_01886 [Trachymyrmex septentrionalis]|uniref:Uncharacterized protein n=1 Tax=Trachymyrmex septentrionalis TaxID=34720 RepID=A0A195FUR9_9HYME|nr:hypothetical protein ALC56_01886 [Trachymyrmex septentrionalis]